MNEETRPIPGYEGRYSVTSFGRVITHPKKRGTTIAPEHFMKPMGNVDGYLRVELTKGGTAKAFLVHRLVCFAFIGPLPSDKHTVNHIDGNKHNNRLDNLEWVTMAENTRHAYRIGLKRPQRGSTHGNAKLVEADVEIIRGLCRLGVPQKIIAPLYSVTPNLISQIHLRHAWKHVA